MNAARLTHWASAVAIVAGLLLMRVPSLACHCESSACCVLTPQLAATDATNAPQPAPCCARHAPAENEDSKSNHPDSGKQSPEDPSGCDCGCTLCKTTNPTPLHDPTDSEPGDILTGSTLDLVTAAAPDVERIALLRPPRL